MLITFMKKSSSSSLFAALIFLSACSSSNLAMDDFAQCITDSGATFYGAWWCPHCNDQKDAFGSSMKNIVYVECSNPQGNARTPACTAAGIEGYPTWEFKDGSRQSGFVPLATLAEKTGCTLPQ